MRRLWPGRTAPEAVLERRYRRLLRWYPAGYRAANEEEMLGVALAGAAPGQRRPGAGEAASLVRGGCRQRLRGTAAALRGEAWPPAAAVFMLLGALLQGAVGAETVAGQAASRWMGFPERWSVSGIVLGIVWSLVVLAALLRRPRVAAVAAALGAVAEITRLTLAYPADHTFVIASWWLASLAVLTALAAAVATARSGADGRPPWPITVVLVSAAAAAAAFPRSEAWLSTVVRYPDGAAVVSNPLEADQRLLQSGLVAVAAIAVLTAVVRQSPAVRRRVVLLAVPVLAAAALSAGASPGSVTPATAVQWAALALVPLLAFGAALTLMSRHERKLRRNPEPG
jgi:hypothetical protein